MCRFTTANVSKKISEFASNLIPGEGHTEASIQLRQNASPDFSILGVREILPMDDGKIFTQFSLMNTEVNSGNGGDERLIGNLGLGARKLSDNNRLMFGINNFYDYDTKYTKGMSDHFIPAELPKNLYGDIKEMTLNCHNILNCNGITRTDFRLEEKSNKPFVLEINTHPGLTKTSLIPELAYAQGISYKDLIGLIIEEALCRE